MTTATMRKLGPYGFPYPKTAGALDNPARPYGRCANCGRRESSNPDDFTMALASGTLICLPCEHAMIDANPEGWPELDARGPYAPCWSTPAAIAAAEREAPR